MKFKYAILYVKNVEQTLCFYKTAFGLNRRMIHDSGDYGELDTGTTILAFSSLQLMIDLGKNPHSANKSSPTFEIAFETENVPKALEKSLKAGATLVQDTQKMPWGQIIAYVSDQNGFLIELCTSVVTHS